MDGGVHIHDHHGGLVCSEMCVVSCAAIGGGAHLLRLHLFHPGVIVGHGSHPFAQGEGSITPSSSLKLSATCHVIFYRATVCDGCSGTWRHVPLDRL